MGYLVVAQYHASGKAVRTLTAKRRTLTAFQADLTTDEGIAALAGFVKREYGRLDVLVNSAAIFYPTPLGKTTPAQWDALHRLNLRAPYFLTQALRPLMRKGAAVVNITDVGGEAPAKHFVPYGTTKAGLIAMTYGLAKELAPDIRVNAVSPGPVLMPENYDAALRAKSLEKTLLKREGAPRNVAHAVRFLIENDYVTGAVVPVDGGRRLA